MKVPESPNNLPMNSQSPSEEEVREELNRILASPALQASEKRREFLRYVVEETLAGRSANIKGFTIAVAVFDRDETFDAQSDAVVRVEARRLRRDLDSYYMHGGNHDAVLISIPKGSYVPQFESLEQAGTSKIDESPRALNAAGSSVNTTITRRLFQRNWISTATAILAVLLLSYVAWMQIDRSKPEGHVESSITPTVLVSAFEALGPTENSRYLAAGISQELVTDLMKFPNLRLYATPSQRVSEASTVLSENQFAPDATYLVSGSVREDGTQVHVVTRLVFAATHRVVWSETYDRPLNPDAMVHLQSDLAEDIATKLGQTYGYIQADMANRLAEPEVSNMDSYLCVQSALLYRRSFTGEQFEPLIGCLEKAVARDPRYSDAWAMLGWLHLDVGRFNFNNPEQMNQEYEKALQFATQAVLLSPDNPLALKALSSINHYMGYFEESERLARKAVAINSNDPDTLVQLGWRLAARGNFEEGIPIIKNAIDRSLNPPGWYFSFVAIQLYMSGQYPQMLSVSERAAVDGSTFAQALIAIACGALMDGEGAREAFAKIPEDSLIARDPETYMRRNGAIDAIVDALMGGLEQAHLVAYGTPE